MDCCITDLGKFPHNKDLDTGLNAGQTGEHKAVLFFGGIRIVRKFMPTVYSDMEIPRPFNETYQYKLQIEQPDGSLYTDNNGCSNFAFKVFINIDSECGSDCNS